MKSFCQCWHENSLPEIDTPHVTNNWIVSRSRHVVWHPPVIRGRDCHTSASGVGVGWMHHRKTDSQSDGCCNKKVTLDTKSHHDMATAGFLDKIAAILYVSKHRHQWMTMMKNTYKVQSNPQDHACVKDDFSYIVENINYDSSSSVLLLNYDHEHGADRTLLPKSLQTT